MMALDPHLPLPAAGEQLASQAKKIGQGSWLIGKTDRHDNLAIVSLALRGLGHSWPADPLFFFFVFLLLCFASNLIICLYWLLC
jgi:hypothetical protein